MLTFKFVINDTLTCIYRVTIFFYLILFVFFFSLLSCLEIKQTFLLNYFHPFNLLHTYSFTRQYLSIPGTQIMHLWPIQSNRNGCTANSQITILRVHSAPYIFLPRVPEYSKPTLTSKVKKNSCGQPHREQQQTLSVRWYVPWKWQVTRAALPRAGHYWVTPFSTLLHISF